MNSYDRLKYFTGCPRSLNPLSKLTFLGFYCVITEGSEILSYLILKKLNHAYRTLFFVKKNISMLDMLTFYAFSVCHSQGQLVTGVTFLIF